MGKYNYNVILYLLTLQRKINIFFFHIYIRLKDNKGYKPTNTVELQSKITCSTMIIIQATLQINTYHEPKVPSIGESKLLSRYNKSDKS